MLFSKKRHAGRLFASDPTAAGLLNPQPQGLDLGRYTARYKVDMRLDIRLFSKKRCAGRLFASDPPTLPPPPTLPLLASDPAAAGFPNPKPVSSATCLSV